MKILLLMAAITALSVGALCGALGGVIAASDGADRWDGTGFATIETPTFALVANPDHIADRDREEDDERSKIQIASLHSYAAGFEPRSGTVFVGVGPAAEVERYLDGVAREYILDIDRHPLELTTEVTDGTRTPGPPGEETFWVVYADGVTRQVATWQIADDQLLVIMRADGSEGIAGEIAFSVGGEYFLALAAAASAIGTVTFVAGIGILFQAVPLFKRQPLSAQEPPTRR